MNSRLLATAALTLPLALTALPAHAALPSGNVLQNGDAEAGPGATNASDHPEVPGWETLPNYTAVVYGAPNFPTPALSASIGGGTNFFAGGPDNGFGDFSIASQRVDLSGAAAEVDRGDVQATLSGHLGGYANHADSATVTAIFTDAAGESINGAIALEPVSPGERGGQTTLLPRTACTTLTPGARELFVQVSMQRASGSYNDGYADNLSVTLSRDPCPTAADAPLPPEAPPEPGVSANADVVSGRILVKPAGGTQFQELRDGRSIPVGSEIDASRGVVSLETAADNRGRTQRSRFYDGAFVMTQTRGARPITDLALSGRLDKCGSRAGKDDAGPSRRTRRLWGNGRGRFRTRGRYATATVRGTIWSVKDSCTSTTVRVRRGTVLVRDLAKRRNVRLKAPKTYIARARRR